MSAARKFCWWDDSVPAGEEGGAEGPNWEGRWGARRKGDSEPMFIEQQGGAVLFLMRSRAVHSIRTSDASTSLHNTLNTGAPRGSTSAGDGLGTTGRRPVANGRRTQVKMTFTVVGAVYAP